MSLIRKYYLCVFLLYAATLFFSFKYLTNDYLINKYKAVGYTPNRLVFLDLAGVLNGIKSKKAGYDPYINNYFDTKQRPFNYPSIWLSLGWFSFININNLYWIGCIVYALFLICYSYALQPHNKKEFIIYYSLLFCPTAIFLVERCNTDIFIFILSAGMLFSFSKVKEHTFFLATGSLCMTASIILKIYPIVYLLLFFILPISLQKKCIAVLFILTLASVYFFFDFKTIQYAYTNTPQVQEIPQVGNFMYGSEILFSTAGKLFSTDIHLLTGKIFCIALLFILVGNIMISGNKAVQHKISADFETLFFVAGGVIFCSTFFAGNNWNYRLIFLVFTLPFLLSDNPAHTIKHKGFLLFLVLFAFWNYLFTFSFPFIIEYFQSLKALMLIKNIYTILFDELINWFLFGMLSNIIMAWFYYVGMEIYSKKNVFSI